MALLNYALTLSEVLSHLGKTAIKDTATADLPKLFFTGEGDIITHGINYLPLFTQAAKGKGMVPVNTSTTNKKLDFLRGDGSWEKITTSDLPMWASGNYTNDTLLTSSQISQLIAANDALVFKGSLGTNGTVSTLPNTHKVGWTYRVITGGTYAGKKCEAGDLITCIEEGTAANDSHWTVIQTNINGSITSKINGVDYQLYGNAANGFGVYAPTTGGTEGQILVSNGNNAPTWQSLALGTGLSQSIQNGTRTISLVNATTSSIGGVKIGSNITISEGSISITKANIIAALGYTPGNASASLVPATTEKIGGIKVGSVGTSASGASITQGPKNYAVHIDSNNLGYVSLPNFVTSSGVTSITITQGTGITVSDSGKAITSTGTRTISLNTATDSTIGGIKIGYETAGKNYAVQLSDGQAYVNVPWIEYSVVSKNANGLAPKVINSNTTTVGTAFYVLASSDGQATPSWYKLPTTAFSDNNTWRAIKVAGTQLKGTATTTGAINFVGGGKTTVSGSGDNITISSTWRDITIGGTSIGDQTLNFIPSGDIYLKTDPNTDSITDISFGLSWYNINTNSYETA